MLKKYYGNIFILLLLFPFINSKGQKNDTLKIQIKERCAIFFSPDSAESIKLNQENAEKAGVMKKDFKKFVETYFDSLKEYNVKIYFTDSRYIQFPFEQTDSTGQKRLYTIDRNLWIKFFPKEEINFGVIWYAGRRDVINFFLYKPIYTIMKNYFFR